MTLDSRTRTNIFLLLFLGVQILLPIRGFVSDKFETRGNFTWNMYASKYSCQAGYTLVRSNGEKIPIDVRRKFRREGQLGKVSHLDVLPSFHAWLCSDLEQRGERGRLFGTVTCRLNEGAPRKLVSDTVNLCGEENYGVLPR
jgi:hypothetical protein